jgi:TonB family protein
MKQLEVLKVAITISVLFWGLSTAGQTPQSDAKVSDRPAVVSAVAPVYPAIALAMNAKGEVLIEVTIDAKGKVVSANVISGNDYLRDSSKKAAMKWQFDAVKEGPQTRATRLTFAYRRADATEPMHPGPEITAVFMPPYRVELISQPYIINN